MFENTLLIIKPDCLHKREQVLKHLLYEGFMILAKRKIQFKPEDAAEFYEEKFQEAGFMQSVIRLSNGVSEACILTKQKAVEDLIRIMLSYFQSMDNLQRMVHVSLSQGNARRDISFIFPNFIQDPIHKLEAHKPQSNPLLRSVIGEMIEVFQNLPVEERGSWKVKLAESLMRNNKEIPVITMESTVPQTTQGEKKRENEPIAQLWKGTFNCVERVDEPSSSSAAATLTESTSCITCKASESSKELPVKIMQCRAKQVTESFIEKVPPAQLQTKGISFVTAVGLMQGCTQNTRKFFRNKATSAPLARKRICCVGKVNADMSSSSTTSEIRNRKSPLNCSDDGDWSKELEKKVPVAPLAKKNICSAGEVDAVVPLSSFAPAAWTKSSSRFSFKDDDLNEKPKIVGKQWSSQKTTLFAEKEVRPALSSNDRLLCIGKSDAARQSSSSTRPTSIRSSLRTAHKSSEELDKKVISIPLARKSICVPGKFDAVVLPGSFAAVGPSTHTTWNKSPSGTIRKWSKQLEKEVPSSPLTKKRIFCAAKVEPALASSLIAPTACTKSSSRVNYKDDHLNEKLNIVGMQCSTLKTALFSEKEVPRALLLNDRNLCVGKSDAVRPSTHPTGTIRKCSKELEKEVPASPLAKKRIFCAAKVEPALPSSLVAPNACTKSSSRVNYKDDHLNEGLKIVGKQCNTLKTALFSEKEVPRALLSNDRNLCVGKSDTGRPSTRPTGTIRKWSKELEKEVPSSPSAKNSIRSDGKVVTSSSFAPTAWTKISLRVNYKDDHLNEKLKIGGKQCSTQKTPLFSKKEVPRAPLSNDRNLCVGKSDAVRPSTRPSWNKSSSHISCKEGDFNKKLAIAGKQCSAEKTTNCSKNKFPSIQLSKK